MQDTYTPTLHKVETRPATVDPEIHLVRDHLTQNGVSIEPGSQLDEYLMNIEARLTIAESALRDFAETASTALTQLGFESQVR